MIRNCNRLLRHAEAGWPNMAARILTMMKLLSSSHKDMIEHINCLQSRSSTMDFHLPASFPCPIIWNYTAHCPVRPQHALETVSSINSLNHVAHCSSKIRSIASAREPFTDSEHLPISKLMFAVRGRLPFEQ